jgi:S1-C subfamily serine protease
MWRRVRVLALLLVVVVAGGVGAGIAGLRAGAPDPSRAAVEVLSSGCGPIDVRSSGVAIGEERVLTVAHAVSGAGRIAVTGVDGVARSAVVVGLDLDRDLALLSAAGLEAESLPLGTTGEAATGTVLGYGGGRLDPEPFRVVRELTASMADVHPQKVERAALEIATSVGPGDSGAALVGESERLVGIVFAASRTRDGRAYALAPAEIEAFLARTAEAPAGGGRCG